MCTFVGVFAAKGDHTMVKPRLTLVGAGPGDPELITLKGIKVLRSADCILYDALANEALLQHAHDSAVKIFVGKQRGKCELSQDEINQLIISCAKKHGHVVRLKGGDPFVFGRATEEINHARKHHMEVDVVPGISSAIAVPETQKIPLTSRGVNESFWVATGSTKNGEISADIYLAAKTNATVIILMAMSRLQEICQIFANEGKAKTPVAIIQNGTLPNEKIVMGLVENIAQKAAENQLKNPAVIMIGEVVTQHPDWTKVVSSKNA